MEELIIDCRTGKQTRRRLTAAEVEQREAEITASEARAKDERAASLKAELARLCGDLKEIYAHQGDGFIAADVGPIEARIAEVKAEIVTLTTKPKEEGGGIIAAVRGLFGG